mgnify:CR=1 FL=1|jgi:hypothetical protein
MFVIFYQSFNVVVEPNAINGSVMVLRNQWTERKNTKDEVYDSVNSHLPIDVPVRDDVNNLVSELSLAGELTPPRIGQWELKDTVLQVQVIKVK